MKGFYNKQEASRILGVSVRQINVYFTQGKLRRVYHGNRVWTPHDDVHQLYDEVARPSGVSPSELRALFSRVDELEKRVETLTLGLGFGARGKLRTETELLLLRQQYLDAMARPMWPSREISQVADDLMSFQPEEISILARRVGPGGWVPICDLGIKMLRYVENHPEFPGKGLDVLHNRMTQARDRFFGLIHASTVAHTGLPPEEARVVRQSIELPPSAIESYIYGYIQRAQK